MPKGNELPNARLTVEIFATKCRGDAVGLTVSHHLLLYSSYFNKSTWFLSDEGPMLETLDNTIRIGSKPTILFFDLYLYCPRSTLR